MTLDFSSCLQKQQDLKIQFTGCITADLRYKKIIELGSKLPLLESKHKTPENLVYGCQSELYLYTSYDSKGLLHFVADSEALISKGLAALLLYVYSEESPETILKCPPQILSELGIPQSLSPSRSNGLSSLYLRMKQEALKHLTPNGSTF